jgi:tRNA threonylcarbamoyladenosine biosynthesis protein TsaE
MAIEDHPPIVKSIAWDNEAQTQLFAQALAGKLLARQTGPSGLNALIQLHGDLGAGKTTFARHLLQALGVLGRVKSPTYAVVEPYAVTDPALDIWHFDFYRFNDPDEWEEAGFRDIFASPGLKLVEWPEKAGEHLPPADLDLHIEMLANETRAVRLSAHTDAGAALLQ